MSKLYFILTFSKKNHYEFICMLERTGSRKVGSIQTSTSNLNNTTNVPSYYNYIYIWGSKWGFKWSQVLKLSFETKFTKIFYLSTKLQLWVGFFGFKIYSFWPGQNCWFYTQTYLLNQAHRLINHSTVVFVKKIKM